MVYDINAILNEPCLNNQQHFLKSLFVDINSDKASDIVATFTDAVINSPIKAKLASGSWLNLCKKIINPLLSCSFEKRPDYDQLQALPFCCKIENFTGQTYGLNIYDTGNRVITVLYNDSSRDNTAVLYTCNTEEPVICGAWVSDVKPALKSLNDTGLQLIKKREQQSTKAPVSVLSTYYRGNTITITDLVDYINRIKTVYDKTNRIR